MDKGLIAFAAVLFMMGGFFYFVERSRFSVKEITLLAVLAGIAASMRVMFSFMPNVQPATFLIIITGFVFGGGAGFLTGTISALVSNLFLGQGPWTLWQMLGWGICGVLGGFLGRFKFRRPKMFLVLAGLVSGYLFGWIMNFWYWYSFTYPLNFKTLVLVNASSFWFDTLHAAGNCFFMYFFAEELIKILRKFKDRITISSGGGSPRSL
ncbi:MAG: ECF transporter S component [Candidatus Omnitrophota bacterium]